MLKRQGLIEVWHDRRIAAGAFFADEIDKNILSADVVLCLLSPDFIASDYCYSKEMTNALERHRSGKARVIPVILRHCEWDQTPLKDLRGTPKDNRPIMAWTHRDEALNDVTKDIRAALEQVGQQSIPPGAARSKDVPELPKPPPNHLRSANLHVKEHYSDLDRDTFSEAAFEFIAELFANSVRELKQRHKNVDGKLTRLDPKRFTVALYSDGKKRSAITVFRGGMHGFGGALSYNMSDEGATNMSNGGFSLIETQSGLRFGGDLFDLSRRGAESSIDQSQVAEALWAKLIAPLQQ